MPSSDSINPQITDPAARRQVWDRQPGETSRAFAAFARYRDQADRRTFTFVAKELSCSLQNVTRWARRWSWDERAAAFDIYQDEQQRAELVRGRMEMRRRHLKMALALQGVAAYALREWQQKIEMQLPLNLQPEEIKALMGMGVKLEADTVGKERDQQFTKIVVNLGEFEYEDERVDHDATEPTTLDGEKKKLLN